MSGYEYAPTATPWPTGTPWPTSTTYPTSTRQPSSTPYPTIMYTEEEGTRAVPAPSRASSGTDMDDDSSLLDNHVSGEFGEPTISPSSTPVPTGTLWPTKTEYPTQTYQPSLTPYPTAAASYETMATVVTSNSAQQQPSSTPASSSGTDIDSLMTTYMSGFGEPTVSPSSTPVPTGTLWPTKTQYPTQTYQPSLTPYPTAATSDEEIATLKNFAPIQAPTKATIASPLDETKEDSHEISLTGSIGLSRTCDGYAEGASRVDTSLLFTYEVQAASNSLNFLTEMEIHIMEHVAAYSLECEEETETPIYRIAYPTEEPVSQTSDCDPMHQNAVECWIIQTKIIVTTKESQVVVAKYQMLRYLEEQLNGGALETDAFPDLVASKYLGPDPVGSALEGTTYTPVHVPLSGRSSESDDTVSTNSASRTLSIFAIAFFSVACVAVLVFFTLLLRSRNKRQKTSSFDDDQSLGIADLLKQSKKRLQNGPSTSRKGRKSKTGPGGLLKAFPADGAMDRRLTDRSSSRSLNYTSDSSRSSRSSGGKRRSKSNLLVADRSFRSENRRKKRIQRELAVEPDSPAFSAEAMSLKSTESWEDEPEHMVRDRAMRHVHREKPNILAKSAGNKERGDETKVNLDPRFSIV